MRQLRCTSERWGPEGRAYFDVIDADGTVAGVFCNRGPRGEGGLREMWCGTTRRAGCTAAELAAWAGPQFVPAGATK